MTKTESLIPGKRVPTQINQAATLEAKKPFYVSTDSSQGFDNQVRVDRRVEVREDIRDRLTGFDLALRGSEFMLYAVRKKIILASLSGRGIKEIVALPAGTPDPDYPALEQAGGEVTFGSHGGILASPHIDVVVGTDGPWMTAELDSLPDGLLANPSNDPLKIPLYGAINFVDDPDMIRPEQLPDFKKGQVRSYGTLLTVGDAVAAHHEAISAVLQQAAPSNS